MAERNDKRTLPPLDVDQSLLTELNVADFSAYIVKHSFVKLTILPLAKLPEISYETTSQNKLITRQYDFTDPQHRQQILLLYVVPSKDFKEYLFKHSILPERQTYDNDRAIYSFSDTTADSTGVNFARKKNGRWIISEDYYNFRKPSDRERLFYTLLSVPEEFYNFVIIHSKLPRAVRAGRGRIDTFQWKNSFSDVGIVIQQPDGSFFEHWYNFQTAVDRDYVWSKYVKEVT